MRKTDILEVISRKLAPFVLLFGFYVVAWGHLSPGGGFQGGVVLASAIMLLLLCNESHHVLRVFSPHRLALLEAGAFMALVGIGVAGMFLRGEFLALFLPVTSTGNEPVAGFIFMLNFIIGIKVGAGISLVCYFLLREEQ